jgi:hypothetical protein
VIGAALTVLMMVLSPTPDALVSRSDVRDLLDGRLVQLVEVGLADRISSLVSCEGVVSIDLSRRSKTEADTPSEVAE